MLLLTRKRIFDQRWTKTTLYVNQKGKAMIKYLVISMCFLCSNSYAGTIVNGIYMEHVTELRPGIFDNKTCYVSHMGKSNEDVSC